MISSAILIVDDEPYNRNAIIRQFEDYDIEFFEAGNGKEALECLEKNKFDLILLDIRMPIMDGFDFLANFSDLSLRPKPPVCVMTAFNDSTTRRKAIYLGADDFINKPIDSVELETRIASLLRISNFQQDLNTLNKSLAGKVREKTKELQNTLDKLVESKKENNRAYREMVSRISAMTEFDHSSNKTCPRKLGVCAAALGWFCGLEKEESENLALSAQLYDIGMLSLPDRLRDTPEEELNNHEMIVLASHTKLGANIFDYSEIALMKQAYNICLYHHEAFDGSGRPGGVKGKHIPVEARIFSVAKVVVETMELFPEDPAAYIRNAVNDLSGILLDPEIVDVLINKNDNLAELLQQLR